MYHDVTRLEVLEPYRLRITFEDGTCGEVDVRDRVPFVGVFAPLEDPRVFAQARIDPELRTVVWPTGADLAPDAMYERIRNAQAGDVVARNSTSPPTRPAPAESTGMPELSRFLGLVISMYYDDHEPPHFHVRYGEHIAAIRLSPLGVLRGSLPRRALAIALEWAELHEPELQDDWNRARRGEPLVAIAPLE